MQRNRLKVLIIGAGTGGLALAQGLQAAGIAVEVYEREHTPIERAQGYRLSVNPAGCRALKACLPAALYAKFLSNSAKPSETVTFLDHRLNRLLAINIPRHEGSDTDNERPIARLAFRSVLLDGLDRVVRFGKKIVAYEDGPASSVTARFDDGSSATGDVLIGADGASSSVRGQLLPHARRVETGITAISGKLGLTAGGRNRVPTPILRGPTLILDARGHFMFANAVEYERRVNGAISNDGSAQDREEYVMWGVSARTAAFGSTPNAALGGEALKAAALQLMTGWSPAVRRLVENADASTVVTFRVKSSTPVEPWPTRNVTLIGDALHNMTPFRGIGANTALRDADALRRALIAVDRGAQNLLTALAACERDMIDYGFKAVGVSLQMMRRVHAETPIERAVTKLVFRTVDHVKPLQPMFMGRQ